MKNIKKLEEFVNLLTRVADLSGKLSDIWTDIQDEDEFLNFVINDNYTLQGSFDDYVFELMRWKEGMEGALKNSKDEAHEEEKRFSKRDIKFILDFAMEQYINKK